MLRRYGAFDANIKNVLLVSFGHPPKNRPVSEIAPGFKFHFEHMGFHAQIFKQFLSSHFQLQKVSHSPFASFGSCLMPEVYFIAQKAS